jgi:hypothetical protein
MAVGCVINGIAANALRSYGVTTERVSVVGIFVFAAALGLIACVASAGSAMGSLTLWIVFAVFALFPYLLYPMFISMFDNDPMKKIRMALVKTGLLHSKEAGA